MRPTNLLSYYYYFGYSSLPHHGALTFYFFCFVFFYPISVMVIKFECYLLRIIYIPPSVERTCVACMPENSTVACAGSAYPQCIALACPSLGIRV